jgi:membrane associated rhomboid family serine protease
MDPETTLPTCYRHPDRETRLACSSCERPICVECMRTASVGQKCPECAAPEGRSRVIRASDIPREQRRAAPVSYAIIAVCVGIFAVAYLSSRTSPALAQVIYGFGVQHNGLIDQGQLWRLFTSMFLHSLGLLMHVIFNMYALYLFGPPLEREVGSAPFAALYLASGLAGGALFYLLVPGGQAVGASGAIFGLFGAWLVSAYRNRHTLQGRSNLNALLILLALNAAITFFPGLQIAWQAHLGGLVAGALVVTLWFGVAEREHAGRLRTMIGLAVAALAVGIVIVA